MEFKNIEVSHMQHALRGMRNAMSGWDKSDTITEFITEYPDTKEV